MLICAVLAAARHRFLLVPVVVLVAGCSGTVQPSLAPSRAPSPATSAAVTATPSTAPTKAAALDRRPAPTSTWGDWMADVDGVEGLLTAGPRIQLSINWQDGLGVWVQTAFGEQVLLSTSVAAQAGEIRLVSDGSANGCAQGDEGRYAWDRAEDGPFLTLTAVEEACAVRGAALARTWVHSLGAVNDGGPGVARINDPLAVQATLPVMRFAMSGGEQSPDIHSFDEDDPQIALVIITNPTGVSAPCASTRDSRPIDPTTDAFVTYVRGLPGFDVGTKQVQVDGRPAVRLTLTPEGESDCASGEVAAFRDMLGSADAEWALTPDDPHTFWIVDVDGETVLLWYEGEGVTRDDQEAVMSSIRFISQLPTP